MTNGDRFNKNLERERTSSIDREVYGSETKT